MDLVVVTGMHLETHQVKVYRVKEILVVFGVELIIGQVAAVVALVLLVVMVLLLVPLDLLLASLEALWNMHGEVHLTLIHQHLETVLEL